MEEVDRLSIASNSTTENFDPACLDLSLNELDDAEFDLPPVENPPTLESILNEPDDGSTFKEDDLDLFHDSGDTVSISSLDGSLGGPDRMAIRRRKNIQYALHGSIVRHVMLRGISSQLISAADRVDAGTPTAMAVSLVIAVGTSHGLVLVFDPKQALRWCLGSTIVGAQYGSVSALGINRDCTRLLCGFAKGQITMYDLTTGKLLRNITDAHPPGTAILHVKFTDDLTLAVCSDSGGSVFELNFKRVIGVRTCDSRCLFSGSRGEVCCIEPLHVSNAVGDHSLSEMSILAMASLSKVIIVSLRPKLKVMCTFALKGDPSCLPLLCWQFVIIQIGDVRVVDPVLAFGRERTISFYQVSYINQDTLHFQILQRMESPYLLLNFAWLNSRTLVILDTTERIHVLDVRSEEELEVIDVADVQLVYGSSHFKGLSTGGNVSKAMALAGERACYQSVMSFGGQLLFLGTKAIHVMTLRNWRERIDVLVRQNKYPQALALALSFYEDRAKAVMGLVGPRRSRKLIIADKILELLNTYVDLSMLQNCPERGKIEVLEEYFQEVVPICVDYCLVLERSDILFGRIYDRCSCDPIAKGVFLETLESYILNDKLTSITPAVMKDFVERYISRNLLQNLEACIVHLNIESLDIHQVVTLCRTHKLYDAIVYVYNKGMKDFITPLEELLMILQSAIQTKKQLTDEQITLGNKLFVYISCCLAGRAYPRGEIEEELIPEVKDDILKIITLLHTKNHKEDEPVFPYLRTLLHFNTREFLNVLALAFEEPEFKTEAGIHKCQRLVDILLQIMVESNEFIPSQVGSLFTFLARQMAKRENTIVVNRLLFEQVLEFLSNPGNESRHEERQQALLELLSAGGLKQFDDQKLLTLAENAQFYRVCELLYEKHREFDKILICYLKDPSRKHQAFSFIENILSSPNCNSEEKNAVKKEALKNLEVLISVNSKKMAKLILLNMNDCSNILHTLENNRAVLYEFLHGLFEFKESTSGTYNGKELPTLDAEIYENYVDLMCEFNPSQVYNFIKRAEGYRLEETLVICRKYKVMDATAFLLERTGDIGGAFRIMLENLQSKVKDVTELILGEKSKEDEGLILAWNCLQTVLIVIIQLCQRNSGKIDESGREMLWFPLLDAVLCPQRKLKSQINSNHFEDFKDLTRHVLNGMMGYVALPAIMQKVMQDPAYNTGKFGEIRELILGMLETYNYEKTLMSTTNMLLNRDLHSQLANLKSAANRGLVPKSNFCNLCSKYFVYSPETERIIIFRCGHAFHMGCLQGIGSFIRHEGAELFSCFLCSGIKKGRQGLKSIMQKSVPPPSLLSEELSDDKSVEQLPSSLDQQQLQALDYLKKIQKTPSRLQILEAISREGSSGKGRTKFSTSREAYSILQRPDFPLRLAPPRTKF